MRPRMSIRLGPPALAFALLAGCVSRDHHAVTYEPPITMDDLAVGLVTPDNGFALLSDEKTVGRFACPLAVARLVPRDGDHGCELRFDVPPAAEQAYWVEQVRGLVALQGLIFLRPASTRGQQQNLSAFCAAAHRLGAPLLLVYARNGLGPNSAQVLGVLYDTATRQPVATIQASSRILDEEGIETSPNGERGDHRQRDARFQAQRKFEVQTLACLSELIKQDTPPATTQPHKWQQPFIERWWIGGK